MNDAVEGQQAEHVAQKKGGAALQKIAGKFSRRSREDALQEVESEADEIYRRLDDVEISGRETAKALASLDKKVGRALNDVVRQMQKTTASQETMIEQILERLRTDVATQHSSAQQFHTVALSKVDDVSGTVSDVKGSLSGIQVELDEHNKLVRRFEDGYDYQILKNFVRHVARVITGLNRQLEVVVDTDARSGIIDARDDLVELLGHNGIEQFKPKLGSAYDEQDRLVELDDEPVAWEPPFAKGSIAVVKRSGFVYMKGTEQERIIQPSLVSVYE